MFYGNSREREREGEKGESERQDNKMMLSSSIWGGGRGTGMSFLITNGGQRLNG